MREEYLTGCQEYLLHRARRRRPQDQRCRPRSPSTVAQSEDTQREREIERTSEIERKIERERKKESERW